MATTLEMLLAALNREGLPPVPDPAKPMPLGVPTPPLAGPMLTGPPDAAPQAPLPALDTNLINQLSGPAPVAPTIQQPSFVDKLSTALLGVSAGLQGRAPQYIESVKEERNRPITEYKAQLERFNNRRTQAVELATGKQERGQERAQRRADANVEFEREQFLQRTKFKSEEARALATQAFELEKIRERERVQDEIQARRERADTERQRRTIENELAGKDGAPSNIAKEISEWRVGSRPELSAAAQKWRGLQARKAEAQLAKLQRIGAGESGGGAAKLAEQFESLKAQLYPARQRGDTAQENNLMRRIEAIGSKLQTKGYEVGYGENPYQKLRGAQQAAPQAQIADPLGIR